METKGKALPDFPFYTGDPVGISPVGWAAIMVGVAIAFAALVLMPVHSVPSSLLPKLLFAGISLAVVAGRDWIALFRPVGLRELGIMLLSARCWRLGSGFDRQGSCERRRKSSNGQRHRDVDR